MVKYCCVKNCKSFWHPKTKVSFYSFPVKNEELYQKWVQQIPTKRGITKFSCVCSEHFIATDYEQRGSNMYVKKTAVPSNFTSHIHPEDSSDESEEYDDNIETLTEDSNNEQDEESSRVEELHIARDKQNALNQIKENIMQQKIKFLQDRVRRRQLKLNNLEALIKDFR